MSAIVQVDAPLVPPHLLAAVQREQGIGVGPAAPSLTYFLSTYNDTVSEQWIRDQHLPAAIEKDFVELVKLLHEEEDLIRYRRRVKQIEQHYGGAVPERGDLPILWFDDDPNATLRKLLILAHGVIVRALFKCDLENMAVAGGIEIQADIPLLVLIDVWCVHYIKRKSLDEMCELTIDWSGDLTAMKACLAAQKRHGELIWDGCVPRVAAILDLNLQVQSTLINTLLKSRHFSTLMAILITTRAPVSPFHAPPPPMQVDQSKPPVSASRFSPERRQTRRLALTAALQHRPPSCPRFCPSMLADSNGPIYWGPNGDTVCVSKERFTSPLSTPMPLHDYNVTYSCGEMDGRVALCLITHTAAESRRNRVSIPVGASIWYDKGAAVPMLAPIRTAAAATAQPATDFGLPGASE